MLCPRRHYFHFGTRAGLLVLPRSIRVSVLTPSFERALASQAAMPELQGPIFQVVGAGLFLLGNLFVLSSMWALGITGTYLGTF
jgi:hypothetical protein